MTREETIETAMSFDMDQVVKRYSTDEEIPLEVAKMHEKELKRFLALCALNPGVGYGMAGIIDELWHTFICFTHEYFDFCRQVNGGYIHHRPEVSSEARSPEPYLKMLADYEVTYGEVPPSDIWPALGRGGDKSLLSCGQSCNTCGRGCSSCGHGCTGCTGCGTGR